MSKEISGSGDLINLYLLVFSGAFLVAVLAFARSIYYCTMKVSLIEGPM